MPIMFIIRAESHSEDLLKEYVKKEEQKVDNKLQISKIASSASRVSHISFNFHIHLFKIF